MRPWTVEHGTLWALETGAALPPVFPAQVQLEFNEVTAADAAKLAVAMFLPNGEPILQRLQSKRRCFVVCAAGQIASYGWVTHGAEYVGELERTFQFADEDAYIWDCGTVSAWRGKHCYSALLSQIVYRLHREGTPRIWIGASLENRPSIRAFANAGFSPVVQLTYRRFRRLTWMWLRPAQSKRHPLVSAAYKILIDSHERCFGRLVIGYRR
jgi:GNAT superfamily N-acetyltransferase